MKIRIAFMMALLALAGRIWAAEIPASFTAEGAWVTLKTNGYYFIATGNGLLGQTTAVPTAANSADYLWQIGGNATDGYTFRSQRTAADGSALYITNPDNLVTNTAEVRLTSSPSRYLYTANGQLQLAAAPTLYLAEYSQNYTTIRLHNSDNYVGSQMQFSRIALPAPPGEGNAVTGADGVTWTLIPGHYITNTSGNYTDVPAGKAWQMELEVENTDADLSFNQWGSTVIASTANPFDNNYWNQFQVYQKKEGKINFKASKGSDHIILQNNSVGGTDYRMTVRCDGKNVYLMHTTKLDEAGQASYDDVWIASRNQADITQLSTALPTGINLRSLRISIAEVDNLLEGVDYAIQCEGSKQYVAASGLSAYAGDAARMQIERTGNEELTFAEQDGGLHTSFYIKMQDAQGQWLYLSADRTFGSIDSRAPFIYTTNRHIAPIIGKDRLGQEWTDGTAAQWDFDFFAHFLVEVNVNDQGGLTYQQGGEQHTATNGQYIWLPAGVEMDQLANLSKKGYTAAISKPDVSLKLTYSQMAPAFYTIAPKGGTGALYYWDGQELVTYSTTNSKSGLPTPWTDQGDCSKFSIASAGKLPMAMNRADDGLYYTSIWCPIALELPSGATAYRLDRVNDQGQYILKPIDGQVLPAETGAVVISSADGSGSWNLMPSDGTVMSETNLFSGDYEQATNPQNTYVLGNKSGIGFYQYTGATLPAFKAYHQLSPSQPAPARFSFRFTDEEQTATGLDEQTTTEQDGIYYDVMGRPVAEPQHGHFYIHNGRKIIF